MEGQQYQTISRDMLRNINQDDICTMTLKDGTTYQIGDNINNQSQIAPASINQRNNQEIIEDRENYRFVSSVGETGVPQPKPCTCQTFKPCDCPCHQPYVPETTTTQMPSHSCIYCQQRKKRQQEKPIEESQTTTLRAAPSTTRCPVCNKEKESISKTTLRAQPEFEPVVLKSCECQNECPTCHQRTSSNNVLRSQVQPERRTYTTNTENRVQKPTLNNGKNETGTERFTYTETVKPYKRQIPKYVTCQEGGASILRSTKPQPQPRMTTCPVCSQGQGQVCPVCHGVKNMEQQERSDNFRDNYRFKEVQGTCPPKKKHAHRTYEACGGEK